MTSIGNSLGIRGNPKISSEISICISQSSKYWYFFTQFFQRSTSNGVSHVREPKTDTGTFSQKIKKLGPHFIFPTHFLMPQGLINPEFSTQKMMSSWNFHKKNRTPNISIFLVQYQPRKVYL